MAPDGAVLLAFGVVLGYLLAWVCYELWRWWIDRAALLAWAAVRKPGRPWPDQG